MRLNDHQNTPHDHQRAKALRNGASSVERKLWRLLRVKAARKGLKFRRQCAVHPYFADFACLEARLLVELDGSSHETRLAYDQARDDDLRRRGFVIARFSNDDVLRNGEGVVAAILEKAEVLAHSDKPCAGRNAPLPNPPHEGEGALKAEERHHA